MSDQQDRIYATAHDQVARFSFDETVVKVFPDMIRRSVPGYPTMIDMIGVLAARYAQAGTCLYDLGSSLGAATTAMAALTREVGVPIVAVDNSPAMIEQAGVLLREAGLAERVTLTEADVASLSFDPCSMAVLNFTLQFIPLAQRDDLIRRLAEATVPGGILVLSEKIRFEEAEEDAQQIELHHAFKRNNGYSELEISQKRNALENVLIPETLAAHEARLRQAGYRQIHVWFRCFNFMSLLAVR
ncbi:MAG: carboxy-S-adenosyl-L-methionine synthase CmoA [Alcanivoracaceae bacterium]|uniref:carboxy-S-adenosyl-L-methionine synthase CmoA n=1 Tax=Alcanivorax sp. MD8A TaxID=1177157 RepID=UPI000C54FC1F|nr:carboxy-S-adenosyl-L-methionine synthase CmoA [Alcanivorax sp. MD8A]MAX56432.1 carboxy-S-adenosyl-L-methionine synthase CmoA [Alcanivoracaceae bacterium]MCG8439467.1 carboxy-S-adenosyl-L-methionine synthase CmoA [Pseudomonadales bacterium]MEE2869647.1 carboxy-S-adenosyl-L-methionine synthase CmoA [Pseudomonadota bacterium]PNE01264.1 methyltransferase [Alcanivorax sp. MD8A]